MRTQPPITTLEWQHEPSAVAACWPRDRPLLWLHSGRVHPRWARWSILATPQAVFRFHEGHSQWVGGAPPGVAKHVCFTHDPLADVAAVLRATSLDAPSIDPASTPFRGGWIGSFSYDLGRVIEPRAQDPHHDALWGTGAGGWPLLELAWCPDALVFDHVHRTWRAIGVESQCMQVDATDSGNAGFHVGAFEPIIAPAQYEAMVARTIEYIAAGDVFQANIAQRFRADLAGSRRGLAIAAFESSRPWYGAYLELGQPASRALLSLSPELFLQANPLTRRVVTRPIKGTRPVDCDVRELRDSIKDSAELNMIVDLMRNDLGRVCEYGSVRVPEERVIETHPTVHHGVAEITGRLREGVGVADLLRATFPPGSVTGAPKIRAMQIIDELEAPHCGRRGPYCGAIGFISDCGGVTLNVAIRTLMLDGARAEYWAGAGIVADSNPRRELQETLDKAAVLRPLSTPQSMALAQR